MKLTLLMAISLDGFIARDDDTTPWSDEEWTAYAASVKEKGNLIVGRKTFDIMRRGGEFDRLGRPFTVVLSETRVGSPDPRTRYVNTPEEAVAVLKGQGYAEAILGGGTAVNTAFLRAGLINEIDLDVESIFLHSGKPLFDTSAVTPVLRLLGSSIIGKTAYRVCYVVRRP